MTGDVRDTERWVFRHGTSMRGVVVLAEDVEHEGFSLRQGGCCFSEDGAVREEEPLLVTAAELSIRETEYSLAKIGCALVGMGFRLVEHHATGEWSLASSVHLRMPAPTSVTP